jgi:hypothetical protein
MRNNATAFPVREATPSNYRTIDTLASLRAAIRDCGKQGALVTIHLRYDPDTGHDLATRSTTHLIESLRALVRKTDLVFLHDHTMYFVLQAANQQGGKIVQERLWEALLWRVHNISMPDMVRPRNMTIGHSTYQEPHTGIEASIEAASIAQLHYEWHPEKSRKARRKRRPGYVPVLEPIDEELPALARKLGIPYLTLLPRKLPLSLQQLVTPRLAQELGCFPVGRERGTLTVAMLDPQNRAALDRLRAETGLRIFPVLTHPHALQLALEQLM